MAMAFPSIPLAEFMMMSENADKIEPNFGSMFEGEPLPVDGYIDLPADKPGWYVGDLILLADTPHHCAFAENLHVKRTKRCDSLVGVVMVMRDA